MEKIKIQQATKAGAIECEVGGAFDMSYPKSKTRRGRVQENGNVSPTLTAQNQEICVICNSTKSGHAAGRMISTDGIAPTAMENHGAVTKIAYDEQNRMFRKDGTVGTLTTDGSSPKHNNRVVEIAAMRGSDTASDKTEQRLEKNGEGVTNALTTVQKDNLVCETNIRIRKLTPRECWRLMGFSDEDFDRARYGKDVRSDYLRKMEKRTLQKTEWRELWRTMRHPNVSNSQLYKQAGNSIVVDVLAAIFGRML